MTARALPDDVYVAHCAALKMKPNSWALTLLKETDRHQVTELSFSPTFLGKNGTLPLLEPILMFTKLQKLCVGNTGLTDYACTALCKSMCEHPELVELDLRGSIITSGALPALQSLSEAWKRRQPARSHSILVDSGYGLFDTAIAKLQYTPVVEAAPIPSPATVGTVTPAASTPGTASELAAPPRRKHTEEFAASLTITERRLDQQLMLSKSAARRIPTLPGGWLAVGVYVSVTFKDFPAEIATLRDTVIPRVNHRLRKLRVQLVLIDFHTKDPLLDRGVDPGPIQGPKGIPTFRKGAALHKQSRFDLFNEEGVRVSEVRDGAIRAACDVFLGLYSGMRDEVHAVDLQTTRDLGESVPILAYHRRGSGVPAALLPTHDFVASVNAALVNCRPQQLEQRRLDLLDAHRTFYRNVSRAAPPCLTHTYDASYARVDNQGCLHMTPDKSFTDQLVRDLFAIGAAYASKRAAATPGVSSSTNLLSSMSNKVAAAPVTITPIAESRLREAPPQPYPMHSKMPPVGDDGLDGEEEGALIQTEGEGIKMAEPGRKLAARIVADKAALLVVQGPAGCGRTTILQMVVQGVMADAIEPAVVATHAATLGSDALEEVLAGLLRQLKVQAPMMSAAYGIDPADPNATPNPQAVKEDMFEDFLLGVGQAEETLRIGTRRVMLAIDDADTPLRIPGANPEGSQATVTLKEFLCSDGRLPRLASAMEHTPVQLLMSVEGHSDSQQPDPITASDKILEDPEEVMEADENGGHTYHVAPFSDHEAASLILHHLVTSTGNAVGSRKGLRDAHAAVTTLVMQKAHGTRPLYCALAANEFRFRSEGATMHVISEALPARLEHLAATVLRLGLPAELEPIFNGMATATAPPVGLLLLNAIRPPSNPQDGAALRCWHAGASRWGQYWAVPPSSAATLFIFFANFRNFLVAGGPTVTGRGLRGEWALKSRTLQRAAAATFAEEEMDHGSASFSPKHSPRVGFTAFDDVEDDAGAATLWDQVMMRNSYLRDSALLGTALERQTPTSFFETPHATFRLLADRAWRTLRRSALNRAAAGDVNAAELVRVMVTAWRGLVRHPLTIYSCPHAFPAVSSFRMAINDALQDADAGRMVRRSCYSVDEIFSEAVNTLPQRILDNNSSFANSSFANVSSTGGGTPTRGSVTPNTAGLIASASNPGSPMLGSSPSVGGSTTRMGRRRVPHKLFVQPSKVRGDFVAVWRSVSLPRHDITPAAASPQVHPSFGFIGVIDTHADARDEDHALPHVPVWRPHKHAISCVEICELLGGAIRIATAAYCEDQVSVLALTHVGTSDAALVPVGRYRIPGTRPTLMRIGVCASAPIEGGSQIGPNDANFCPAIAFGAGNTLRAHREDRFGGDNQHNTIAAPAPAELTGHDSHVEMCGYSPAGTKLFSIDAAGRCMVWRAPSELGASDVPLAVTELGTLPNAAHFVDTNRILLQGNRDVRLWHALTSQIERIIDKPTRVPFDTKIALHLRPPYVPQPSEDEGENAEEKEESGTSLQQELLSERGRRRPTVPAHAFWGATLYDEAEGAIRSFAREELPIPPDSIDDEDYNAPMAMPEETHRSTAVPRRSCEYDVLGIRQPSGLQWALGERVAAFIDPEESMLKLLDLEARAQLPLFFASLPSAADAFEDNPARVFRSLDAVSICEGAKVNQVDAPSSARRCMIVVGDNAGNLHTVEYVRGRFTVPLTTRCLVKD